MQAPDGGARTNGTFVLTRTFAAPRRRVWQAWSEACEMQTWWGPKGCAIDVRRFEFRPGGFFHYAMQFGDGPTLWGRFLYREIIAEQRIAWLNSFSNAGCGITRAPFDPAIPLEILNEVRFDDDGPRTIVTLRATPHGAEPHETATFEGMFASLGEGYGGTFDRLEQSLATVRA